MSILFWMSCAVFTAYILYILHCNTHPKSLSETYYILQQKKLGWVFQITIAIISVLIFPVWFNESAINILFLPFLSCAGLLFVCVAPAFKLELDGMVHFISAFISGLSAIIWIISSGLWYVIFSGILIAYLISLKHGNLLFWLEIMGFICIYYSIIIV